MRKIDTWKQHTAALHRQHHLHAFEEFQRSLDILADLSLGHLMVHYKKKLGKGLIGQSLIGDFEMLRNGMYDGSASLTTSLDDGT